MPATVVALDPPASQASMDWAHLMLWLADLQSQEKLLWATPMPGNVCKVLDDVADDFQYVPSMNGEVMLGAPEPLHWFMALNWSHACIRTDLRMIFLGGRVDYDEYEPEDSTVAVGMNANDAYIEHMVEIRQRSLRLAQVKWEEQVGYMERTAGLLPLAVVNTVAEMEQWVRRIG